MKAGSPSIATAAILIICSNVFANHLFSGAIRPYRIFEPPRPKLTKAHNQLLGVWASADCVYNKNENKSNIEFIRVTSRGASMELVEFDGKYCKGKGEIIEVKDLGTPKDRTANKIIAPVMTHQLKNVVLRILPKGRYGKSILVAHIRYLETKDEKDIYGKYYLLSQKEIKDNYRIDAKKLLAAIESAGSQDLSSLDDLGSRDLKIPFNAKYIKPILSQLKKFKSDNFFDWERARDKIAEVISKMDIANKIYYGNWIHQLSHKKYSLNQRRYAKRAIELGANTGTRAYKGYWEPLQRFMDPKVKNPFNE